MKIHCALCELYLGEFSNSTPYMEILKPICPICLEARERLKGILLQQGIQFSYKSNQYLSWKGEVSGEHYSTMERVNLLRCVLDKSISFEDVVI